MSEPNENPEEVKDRMRAALDIFENYLTPAGKLDGAKLTADIRNGKADGARLDWLLRNVSGKEMRRLGILYSAGCQREDIDRRMALMNEEG